MKLSHPWRKRQGGEENREGEGEAGGETRIRNEVKRRRNIWFGTYSFLVYKAFICPVHNFVHLK